MAKNETSNAAKNFRNLGNQTAAFATAAVLLAALTGCLPSEDDGLLGLANEANSAFALAGSEVSAVDGVVDDLGGYEMFDLGQAAAGDEWTISAGREMSDASVFTVALFDADYNLLIRGNVSTGTSQRVVVRHATENVYLGVMAPLGFKGGEFQLNAGRRTGVAVPAPTQQTVWLNFAGAADVQVRYRTGLSFDAFDAAELGDEYAGQTQAIKDAIVKAMQEDYAAYNVTILTSDEVDAPKGDFTVVHFGGGTDGLLGLADSVDRYNENKNETAVVFVNNFAAFAAMELHAEEMGMMIGNVASHELGHTLGLYHTARKDGLMDTTGSRWDLSNDQAFTGGELDSRVFPVGYENTAAVLADTVGLRAGFEPADVSAGGGKDAHRSMLRDVLSEEIVAGCGLCQELD